jgi:hypothetical protein
MFITLREEEEVIEPSSLSLVQPWSHAKGEECNGFQEKGLQRELDRRRVEITNDHVRDYRDGHGNDLKTGRIALVFVVVLHLEVNLRLSSLSSVVVGGIVIIKSIPLNSNGCVGPAKIGIQGTNGGSGCARLVASGS